MGKSSNTLFADPILVQRVRVIIEDLDLDNPTEYTVLTELTRKHKEYARKNQTQLKRYVGKAIRHVVSAAAEDSSPPPNKAPAATKPGEKRSRDVLPGQGQPSKVSRPSDDSSDEDLDPSVKLVQVEDRNTLNSSLVKSYRRKSESASGTPKGTPVRKPSSVTRKMSSSNQSRPFGGNSTRTPASTRPAQRFKDMGGIEACITEIRELCEYPLVHPELYTHLGVEPPRGILLHGPPGCGKTLLANAIAGELGVPFFKVAAPEIVSGMSGESEEKLRNLFEDAKNAAPAIIFIDEIDAITAKRESTSRGMEKRIVAQLLTCMDSLSTTTPAPAQQQPAGVAKDDTEATNSDTATLGSNPVIVIGATNHPDVLDTALRRAGRFDREIAVGIPDESARCHILQTLATKMRLSGDFDFKAIAKQTPGYVGADLAALTKEAAVLAVNRIFGKFKSTSIVKPSSAPSTSGEEPNHDAMEVETENEDKDSRVPFTPEELEPLFITMEDFSGAIKKVQPSSKREGFATVPSVTWDDVGALSGAREELSLAITEPIRSPERFEEMGLSVPAGVLLYGPPGCGKTLLAKAIANSSGANFISIKGPELLNKYVGESERAVRQVFARARASAPCVIFFDELDALCPRRGSSETGVNERVVNQLLTEMDGLDSRRNVFVTAATNRPDIIDPAMLRPGRLDRLVYVPLPSKDDRGAILKTCARDTPLAADVNLEEISLRKELTGFSGADLAALIREASILALKRTGVGYLSRKNAAESKSKDKPAVPVKNEVTRADFEVALSKVAPSVSVKDQKLYDRMRKRLRSVRSHLEKDENPEDDQKPGGGEV